MFPLTADGLDAALNVGTALALMAGGALATAFGMLIAEAEVQQRARERRTGVQRRTVPIIWLEEERRCRDRRQP